MTETVNTSAQKTCPLSATPDLICSNPMLVHLNILCFCSTRCSLCLPRGFGFHRPTVRTSHRVLLTGLVLQNCVHRCLMVNCSFATHDPKVPGPFVWPELLNYFPGYPSDG